MGLIYSYILIFVFCRETACDCINFKLVYDWDWAKAFETGKKNNWKTQHISLT